MARIADRAKNVRRMGQRRIEALRIDMQITQSDSRRQQIQGVINEMQELINKTRAYENGHLVRGRTQEDRAAAVNRLEILSKELPKQRRVKDVKKGEFDYSKVSSNAMRIESIRVASKGLKTEEATEIETRVFFASTYQAWKGAEKDKRYEAIYEYYGTNDLNAIWDAALALNTKLIDALQRATADEPLTTEQKKMLQDLKRTDDEQEKRYLKGVADSPIIGAIKSAVKELPQDTFRPQETSE